MEGDDGFGDSTCDVAEGLLNCGSEGELVAYSCVDHVFEIFEDGVTGNQATHVLCEHDLWPVFGTDVVGGVDHPECFLFLGGGNYHSVGHTVVGAGEGDVLCVFGNSFTKLLF